MTRSVLVTLGVVAFTATTSAQQPLVAHVSAIPPDGPSVATAWTVTVNGTPASAPTARGPWLELQAGTGATWAQSGPTVKGSFRVRAGFLPAVSTSASYGLRLGSAASYLDILLQSNGRWSVRRSDGTVLQPWTAIASSLIGHGIDAEVEGTMLIVWIDGTRVGAFTIGSGSLDGQPGVWTDAGGDVFVSGFTIEGAGGGQ